MLMAPQRHSTRDQRKRSTRDTETMGLYIDEYEIMCAPPDEIGNNEMAMFADAFVQTHFRGGVLLNKDVGNNRALVLTNGNYQPGGEYECVLGEYPFFQSRSSPQMMNRVYYAEFLATSAKLAAFMERCGYGEAHSLFAQKLDTFRQPWVGGGLGCRHCVLSVFGDARSGR
jgi:hypothetical protein